MVVVEIEGGITTPSIYVEMVTKILLKEKTILRSEDKFYIQCFKYKRYQVLILNKIVK